MILFTCLHLSLLQTLENSMGAAMTLSTPQDQVDQLIQEVADESGLDVIDQLKDLNPTTSSISASKTVEHQKEDDLSRRFVIDLLHISNLIIKLYIFNSFLIGVMTG